LDGKIFKSDVKWLGDVLVAKKQPLMVKNSENGDWVSWQKQEDGMGHPRHGGHRKLIQYSG
jgi:hypothetical protein